MEEEFLEDINNILNSGEVPNLFEGDEFEKVVLDAREGCNQSKKGEVRTKLEHKLANFTLLHLLWSF